MEGLYVGRFHTPGGHKLCIHDVQRKIGDYGVVNNASRIKNLVDAPKVNASQKKSSEKRKMLTTFENINRQNLRRDERERHIRRMEAFARSLEFDDLPVCAMADALSGGELEKMPEPRTSRSSKFSRKVKFVVTFCVVLAVMVISFVLGLNRGQHDASMQVTTNSNDDADFDFLWVRQKTFFSLILDWGFTSRERLEDPLSPAARALDWLVYTDTKTNKLDAIRTRYALACFFFATQSLKNEQKWIEDRHWLSSYPVCLWYGIECTEQRDEIASVRSLNLSSNALTGTIPQEIGMLGLDVQTFDVSYNMIGGSIPTTLFSLTNLVDLYLGPNLLSSSIPTQIGLLDGLRQLYIHDCALNGSIPEEIGNLTNLYALGLQNNGLEGALPSSIAKLKTIAVLYLDNNRISSTIPKNLGELSNLVDLRLRLNMLSGTIPPSIGDLKMLQLLYLDSNKLEGSLPSRIGNLRLLRDLHLYNNELDGSLPLDLGHLELLRVFYADSNRFAGPIPTSIGQMRHLESVYLSDNKLVGSLPTHLGSLSKLQELRVDLNLLTGSIPLAIGELQALEVLFLQDNMFSGTIPFVLGLMRSMEQIQLHRNNFTGNMPMKVCVMASFNLKILTADCDFHDERVACNCCTRCF